MIQRVEVVVDGVPIETWVASESEAEALAEDLLTAAEEGTTVRIAQRIAKGEELDRIGTIVLRLGSASSLVVRVVTDDGQGAAMGISR